MSPLSKALSIPLLLTLAACQQQDTPPTVSSGGIEQEDRTAAEPSTSAVAAGRDYHSYANPEVAQVTHLSWQVAVDFESQTLTGQATLKLQRRAAGNQLILDSKDLIIDGVNSDDRPLNWQLGQADPLLGAPLNITLLPTTNSVTIHYRSRPEASGLQWLTPAQTSGDQPFLFTQSQPHHARSWIPLQDTPQVRFTFEASVTTTPGLRAVMSADNDPQAQENGHFQFTMPQPIPSYLMALAVGDLDFAAMSERTGVYAEPAILAAAAAEFADTEAMMQAAEKLFGPYRWGRYDLLILPPSFPFGGMENPRLSFITPTVIAGDKSLVALIAHELAHSWSGNLVTNATWNDLWLNEGFTVYLEARIMEVVYSPQRRAMEDVLGYQSLVDEFAQLEARDQHLWMDLRNRDPDLAFSSVPYEKGRLLLVWLEQAFGRPNFDAFLRQYFDRYAFQSLDTASFLDYLDAHLLSQYPGNIDRAQVDAWINQPGLPQGAALPSSDAFTRIDRQRENWLRGETAAAELSTDDWSVHEWRYFLNNMPAQLSTARLEELDQAFSLTTSSNNEIAHSWLRIAIGNRYQPAMTRLRDYLISIGRRKLITPLYEALVATDWGVAMARDIYAQARPGYHPQAAQVLDAIVLP